MCTYTYVHGYWLTAYCLHSILGKHLFISLSWVALDQCLCVITISYLMINCHFSYSKLEERYVCKHIMINWWCLLHSVLMTFKLDVCWTTSSQHTPGFLLFMLYVKLLSDCILTYSYYKLMKENRCWLSLQKYMEDRFFDQICVSHRQTHTIREYTLTTMIV